MGPLFMVAGAIGAVAVAPAALSTLGFTAAGIKAGSVAATMMSTLGGATTTSGGIVATCQSIGATGTVLGSGVATTISAMSGATVGLAASGMQSCGTWIYQFSQLLLSLVVWSLTRLKKLLEADTKKRSSEYPFNWT